MLNVARILAVLSIVSTDAFAVVAIGAGCFNLLHLGFEFVLVFGGLFFNLAAVTGFLALLTVFVRALLGAKGGNARVVLISVASLLLLGAGFVFMEPVVSAQSACWWMNRVFQATSPLHD